MGPILPMPPQFVSFKTPDQEFWETIFQELVANAHDPQDAARYADEALEEWRKRWPPRQIAAPALSAEIHTFQPPPLGINHLMTAQTDLEKAQQQLANIRRLADLMPNKELAEAYFAVEGAPAQQRVEFAEQQLKRVQDIIENQEKPEPTGDPQ